MEPDHTTRATGPRKRRRASRELHDVKTKCEAVLSIWSERRKPAEICRELGINWAVLNSWQNKALEGMMQALDTSRQPPSPPTALPPQLQKRFASKLARREAKRSKLEKRLSEVMVTKQKEPAKESAKE